MLATNSKCTDLKQILVVCLTHMYYMCIFFQFNTHVCEHELNNTELRRTPLHRCELG